MRSNQILALILTLSLSEASFAAKGGNGKGKKSPAASPAPAPIVVGGEDTSLCESNSPGGSASSSSFWAGSGSIDSPFLICTASQLNLVGSSLQNGHYRLINNIDLSKLTSPFKMITLNKGSFSGGNYEIKNLKIEDSAISHWNGTGFFQQLIDSKLSDVVFTAPVLNIPNANSAGIIGYAERIQVSNVKINNLYLRANSYAGGLVGSTYQSSSFLNVQVNTADIVVAGASGGAGGLIGYSEGSYEYDSNYSTFTQIKDSQFSGSIRSSGNLVGGILGDGYWMNLENVSSNARLEGIYGVGGLVGSFYVIESFLKNSQAQGEVHAQNYGGGLLGDSTPALKISDCKSSVAVSASKIDAVAGRLFGRISPNTVNTNNSSTGSLSINGVSSTADVGVID